MTTDGAMSRADELKTFVVIGADETSPIIPGQFFPELDKHVTACDARHAKTIIHSLESTIAEQAERIRDLEEMAAKEHAQHGWLVEQASAEAPEWCKEAIRYANSLGVIELDADQLRACGIEVP